MRRAIIGETLLARGRFDLTRTDVEVVEDDGADAPPVA